MSGPAYRVESVAYLKCPDVDGSKLLNLGDWYDEDPVLALSQLMTRVSEVAFDLGQEDPATAHFLHGWISNNAGREEVLDRLRNGYMVSCVADGGEAVFEFLVRPIPMNSGSLKVVPNCG